jgi:hypothetical protein
MGMTRVERVRLLGGQVTKDYRFLGTPTPWVAKLPGFTEIGLGENQEVAARNVLKKRQAEKQAAS